MSGSPRVVPPGWYVDPGDASAFRWWDGLSWTDRRAVFLEEGTVRSAPPRPHDRKRIRLWLGWAGVSSGLFVVGVVLLIGGGVRLDHTTGHFGRVPVPGESYGLPDEGTYVIADGEYAAAMHTSPVFTVTGPTGQDVPVEPVPDHRYGREDNALALFFVATPGRYRLQVEVPVGAEDDVPRTVTVDRSMDGTGDPLTAAYVAVVAGLVLCLASAVLLVVSVVNVLLAYLR